MWEENPERDANCANEHEFKQADGEEQNEKYLDRKRHRKGFRMKKGIMLSILITGIIALIVAALGYFSGFLVPHTTDRSREVQGRVLDAITHAPIQGAKISFESSPYHPVYTDAAGHFHRQAIRNFHWGYTPPEGHWPNRKDSLTVIMHPGYLPLDGDWTGDAGDILLKPDK